MPIIYIIINVFQFVVFQIGQHILTVDINEYLVTFESLALLSTMHLIIMDWKLRPHVDQSRGGSCII